MARRHGTPKHGSTTRRLTSALAAFMEHRSKRKKKRPGGNEIPRWPKEDARGDSLQMFEPTQRSLKMKSRKKKHNSRRSSNKLARMPQNPSKPPQAVVSTGAADKWNRWNQMAVTVTTVMGVCEKLWQWGKKLVETCLV